MPQMFSLAGASNSVANIYSQQNALTDSISNSAGLTGQANVLSPYLGGLGTNLAALMANGSNSVANPSLSAAATTLLQQQLSGILHTTPVVLVSNLDEKVSRCPTFGA